jgi:AAHS family benzoate transporter-like MFS transporter
MNFMAFAVPGLIAMLAFLVFLASSRSSPKVAFNAVVG